MKKKNHIKTELGEGVIAVAYFDHQPWEPETRFEPEVFASITINSILINEYDVLDDLNEKAVAGIEAECLSYISDDEVC